MNENTHGNDNQPAHDEVAHRAYLKYLERGAQGHGFDLQDWFDAEAELRGPISSASQEAIVRGAEAEAAQEKREAELDGPLPPAALDLMTSAGEAMPRSAVGATKPRKGSAKTKTTTADVATPATDGGGATVRKARTSKRSASASAEGASNGSPAANQMSSAESTSL